MLAETPIVGGSTRAKPFSAIRSKRHDRDEANSGLSVRRIGLEQEFFLVDQRGMLSDLADEFLLACREAARTAGLDPRCFKTECVKSLVEMNTPPSSDLDDLADNYLSNLNLALEVALELGLALYPLGTYPLPINPVVRDDPGYRVQASTIGDDRFLSAGRCAGTHLHIELPAGTVWPDVKAALDAPSASREELLGLYNLATALDPALVALTRACPFYEGRMDGFASRTVHYRGIFGFDGLYANLQEAGALSDYATRVEELVDQERARYGAWFAAMDLAGVERQLFALTGADLHRASWNPVRLNHHGTLEIRSIDSNLPGVILQVCALICGAVERVRSQRLKVMPSREVRTVELEGDLLLVPDFTYLSGELLGAAASLGVEDPRIESYLDSFVRFASAYVEWWKGIPPLGGSGSYRTTESWLLESYLPVGVPITRYEGLSLVREACHQLKEQVSSLHRKSAETPLEVSRDRGVADMVYIRDAPTDSAVDEHATDDVDETQASSRGANEGPHQRCKGEL